MTRQIKFRAWKKSEQRMVSWDEFINNPDDLIAALTFVKYEKTMQYTGLKDKNGVEIYEGDIVVEKDCGRKLNTEVKFDLAGVSCSCNNEGSGYYWNAEEAKYVEVIGNIYENPELLAA